MKGYADTGFLCSLYAPDAHTEKASERMETEDLPLPLVWMHQLEFRNAMRLRVYRREITVIQRDASLNTLLRDLAGGVLVVTELPLSDVMLEAERLSALHSETIGTRSLDILHVAAALVLGCGKFLTFDIRQAELAGLAGLNVPALLT